MSYRPHMGIPVLLSPDVDLAYQYHSCHSGDEQCDLRDIWYSKTEFPTGFRRGPSNSPAKGHADPGTCHGGCARVPLNPHGRRRPRYWRPSAKASSARRTRGRNRCFTTRHPSWIPSPMPCLGNTTTRICPWPPDVSAERCRRYSKACRTSKLSMPPTLDRIHPRSLGLSRPTWMWCAAGWSRRSGVASSNSLGVRQRHPCGEAVLVFLRQHGGQDS